MTMNVKLALEPPVAVVTLNRPEVRNALSPALMDDFHQALNEVESCADIAGVVVTGEGSAFSAGVDLTVLKKLTEQSAQESRQDALHLRKFLERVYRFPKPVVAAVNGAAMGGGCGLVSACDIAVAAEDALFGYTEVKVGFIPALVSVFLLRRCGERKVRELLLTGRIFSALEAQQLGLVDQVVPGVDLLSRARAIVETISRNSPSGVRLTKNLLEELPGLSLEQALAVALELNALARTSQDFKEGVTAFLEKRPPNWKK